MLVAAVGVVVVVAIPVAVAGAEFEIIITSKRYKNIENVVL